MNIEELINAGFTYEELYKKGVLTVRSSAEDSTPEDPTPADPAPADPAPEDPTPADPAPAEDPIIKALREEIAGLKTAIQNINIKQAERGGGAADPKPLSVDEAILGLVKEM